MLCGYLDWNVFDLINCFEMKQCSLSKKPCYEAVSCFRFWYESSKNKEKDIKFHFENLFGVVVVVKGLFHVNLKYKYFYNDACIEMGFYQVIESPDKHQPVKPQSK